MNPQQPLEKPEKMSNEKNKSPSGGNGMRMDGKFPGSMIPGVPVSGALGIQGPVQTVMPGMGGIPSIPNVQTGAGVPAINSCICGQHQYEDYGYPKSIQSRNIVELSTSFDICSPDDSSLSGRYFFVLEKRENKVRLKEQYRYRIEDDVDISVLDELQNIIESNGLVKGNGIVDVKQGLPAQLQPCHLKVVYDTGERLYFEHNNHPFAQWAIDISEVLRRAFVLKGHTECDTPVGARSIKRANFEFRIHDLAYRYGELRLNNGNIGIERYIYNKIKDDIEAKAIIQIPDQYYARLHERICEIKLKQFHTGQGPFGAWKFDHSRYYYFYIEYENGNRLCDYSVDPDRCNAFYGILPELISFLDQWFDSE